MNHSLIVKGIEVIGVLFAAFGGFLTGIAPPQAADSRFAVGISSFLMLTILLMISALSKRRYKNYWLIAAGILIVVIFLAGYTYKERFDRLVFEYPPGNSRAEHIAGTTLTPDARDYKAENPTISNAQLLFDLGGLPEKESVWTVESIRNARMQLIVSYVLLVLSIAGAIFAVTEGVLVRPEKR